MEMIIQGFTQIMNPVCILLLIVGITMGAIFGCIPGLNTNMCLGVVMPIAFTLDPIRGICLLFGVYIGGCSGGLISAVLLGIPGTGSNVATTFDGYPMARNGEPGKALAIGIFYSFCGTLLGFLALIGVSPLLSKIGLKFSYYEYFALGVFALTIIGGVVSGSVVKGLASAAIGMLLALVGMAPVDSVVRLTFGARSLRSGFKLLALTIGFYAVGALIDSAEKGKNTAMTDQKITGYQFKGFGFSLNEFIQQFPNMIRSALIGIGIGILPGMGGGISNLIAYSVAKNRSKYPERFGTGIIDGIVAPETANNATIGGSITPMLSLGVPGSGATALLMGALIVFGIQPGPMLFETNGPVVYSIYFLLLIGSFFMLCIIRLALPFFVSVLNVPKYILMPVLILMSSVGAFASSHMIYDVWVCFFFGIFSYYMRKLDIPIAPLVISFIMTPIIEANLRRGLIASPTGNIWYFFTRPIACVFFVIAAVSVGFTIYRNIRKSRMVKQDGQALPELEEDED